MSAHGRHRDLAAALPISGNGPIVDLGCGRGLTLQELRERLGPEVKLAGVDRKLDALEEGIVADANVEAVAADLNQPLPFDDGRFEAAICHNALECLPDKQRFLAEVARVLRPGGHLLLGHTDFDTFVFNAVDLELTRGLVHANADTQEAWMDASDGTIGRKLVAIARQSPFELAEALAWVTLDTTLAEGGAADTAVRSIAGAVRRDGHEALAARLGEWIAELHALAERGEFLFSVND